MTPPKGAIPICSRCGTVLERQPIVRPIPFIVLLTVGSGLIALSIPGVFAPSGDPGPRPVPPSDPTPQGVVRHGEQKSIG
ncbi:MAG: hypothetical protein VKK03_05340 [Synechococcus sp.]|nr:hypothetical protein [Synechococcus sp.]